MQETTTAPIIGLVCYICGKEYGLKRIENHVFNCEQKWEVE